MRDVDDQDRCPDCGHPYEDSCDCRCCLGAEDPGAAGTEEPAAPVTSPSDRGNTVSPTQEDGHPVAGPERQGSLDRGGPYIECAVCHRHHRRGDEAREHARSHWRKAVAEWHAQQRRTRWRRTPPEPTGYVKPAD